MENTKGSRLVVAMRLMMHIFKLIVSCVLAMSSGIALASSSDSKMPSNFFRLTTAQTAAACTGLLVAHAIPLKKAHDPQVFDFTEDIGRWSIAADEAGASSETYDSLVSTIYSWSKSEQMAVSSWCAQSAQLRHSRESMWQRGEAIRRGLKVYTLM